MMVVIVRERQKLKLYFVYFTYLLCIACCRRLDLFPLSTVRTKFTSKTCLMIMIIENIFFEIPTIKAFLLVSRQIM